MARGMALPAIRIDNIVKRYAAPKGAKGADAQGKLALKGVDIISTYAESKVHSTPSQQEQVILECLSAVERESGSTHVVAEALVERAERLESRADPDFCVVETNTLPGCGVTGSIECSTRLMHSLCLEEKHDTYEVYT